MIRMEQMFPRGILVGGKPIDPVTRTVSLTGMHYEEFAQVFQCSPEKLKSCMAGSYPTLPLDVRKAVLRAWAWLIKLDNSYEEWYEHETSLWKDLL
jgi:hypothetical protein